MSFAKYLVLNVVVDNIM